MSVPEPQARPSRAQRVLAVVLTVMFFALVVLVFGAIFAAFDHRGWGYLIGIGFCLVMAVAALRTRNR